MLCKHPISKNIYNIYIYMFIFQMYIPSGGFHGGVHHSFQLIHDLQSALEVHREKTSPIGCLADQLTWSKMIAIQNLGFK